MRPYTTLAEGLERYAQEVTPYKKGVKAELARIRVICKDPLAKQPLVTIRSSDIASWRSSMQARGLAPSTIKNRFAVVSQTFQVAALEWGFDGLANPVKGVRLPPARLGRDRRLEHGEEGRLRATGSVILPAMTWAIETAMRQGEQLQLRREDISGNVAILRTTKNGRPRFVPLSSRAMALLEGLPKRGRLFPFDEWQLRFQWKQACRNARITNLRWHDLRHEAISRMAEKGLDMLELMAEAV
jgi:integrase